MKNPLDLTGKTILVSGASSGIGRATAILLSQLGARCILVARREEELLVTAESMSTEAKCYPFDLEKVEIIGELLKEIIADGGALDGFVHSAGISTTVALRALPLKTIEKSMRINFYSFLEIVKHISKPGNFNKGLSIVAISSIAALQGNSGKTLYCATKAALDASIRCLAKELSNKKIRVNGVAPALIRTAIVENLESHASDLQQLNGIIARQYMGLGEPVDVANMVAYLLSTASKFITGTIVPLDGGRLSS